MDKIFTRHNLMNICTQNGINSTKDITTFTVPDEYTEIGADAFANCRYLRDVQLPDTITKIDVGAFMECDSLHTINMPKNIKQICYRAFDNCYNLMSVDLSNTDIEHIENRAFYNCDALSEIKLPKHFAKEGKALYALHLGIKPANTDIIFSDVPIINNAAEWDEKYSTFRNALSDIENYIQINDHIISGKISYFDNEELFMIDAYPADEEEILALKDVLPDCDQLKTYLVKIKDIEAKTCFTIKHPENEEVDKSDLHSSIGHMFARFDARHGYETVDIKLSDWREVCFYKDDDSDEIETEYDADIKMDIAIRLQATDEKSAQDIAKRIFLRKYQTDPDGLIAVDLNNCSFEISEPEKTNKHNGKKSFELEPSNPNIAQKDLKLLELLRDPTYNKSKTEDNPIQEEQDEPDILK